MLGKFSFQNSLKSKKGRGFPWPGRVREGELGCSQSPFSTADPIRQPISPGLWRELEPDGVNSWYFSRWKVLSSFLSESTHFAASLLIFNGLGHRKGPGCVTGQPLHGFFCSHSFFPPIMHCTIGSGILCASGCFLLKNGDVTPSLLQGGCGHCPSAWSLWTQNAEEMEEPSFLFLDIVWVSTCPKVSHSGKPAEACHWPFQSWNI